jgi:aminoglycoside 3'-phosphotransferase-2
VPPPTDEALARLLRDGWDDLRQAHIESVVGGWSGASVYRVRQDQQPLRYLKIARNDAAALLRDEIARTQWLAAHGVLVPTIQQFDDRADQVALLSNGLPGATAEAAPLPVPKLIDTLAAGLAALHAVPTADCPFDESLEKRLSRATAAVTANEIDPSQFANRNRGIKPGDLLARMVATQPAEDLVVVHGDATLSNLIVDKDGHVGFVDCGNAGHGDRYIDLAVLADDIRENFGPAAAARFAKAYGSQPWDRAKAAYFLDLYELF